MYNKLKAVISALFVTIAVTSFSQTSHFSISLNTLTTNFNYGSANAGLKDYKKDYRGFQAGFSYQAGISSSFSLVPEIYFAMKGGTLKENNPLTLSKSTLRLSTIDLPVLARVHFDKLYINAGPYAGYALSGRFKTAAHDSTAASSSKISFGNSSSSFRRWDIGWQAGAGYHFNVSKSVLTLDVRYGYGLVSVSRDIKRYNRMLNISLLLSKPARKKQAAEKE